MEDDKKTEKKSDALKEEELDSVAGGMRTSGFGNPLCPKCGSEMDMRTTGYVFCQKCGYEREATVAWVGNKG